MSREQWIAIGIAVVIVGILTLYGAIRLLVKVFRMRKVLGDLTPGGKFAFYGSLLYTIFPVDLLPDPIYLDDMAVLGTALVYLTRLVRRRGLQVPVQAARASKRVGAQAARQAGQSQR